MPDIFLSYAREDQVTARRFAGALQREGLTVWWDQSLDAGESFDKVTEQSLKDAKAVVVLWSKKAVDSRWVRSEATLADRYGTLVPVTIEPCDRPIMFELTHTADLSAWNGDVSAAPWRAFMEGLKRTLGKSALSPAPSLVESAAPAISAVASPPSGRTAITWTSIGATALLAAGLFLYSQGRETRTPDDAGGLPATTATTASASIAVLPFRDLSQGKDQEYFADGVTEEILNSLAGLKDLKVTARTSAFAFKGTDVDLRTVGATLGVQHILEGSIRKDGETLRITAKLIDAGSNGQVWSKTYDRPLNDIFKVQEDIARSVAEALQVTLGVGFGSQPGMTRNVEAYDAYLAAFPLTLQVAPEARRRAIVLLEQAVALDKTFGAAWLRLASAYRGMTGLVTGDAQVWHQKADSAIENALRFAPETPGVHSALAARDIDQRRWREAAGHFKDAPGELSKPGAPAPVAYEQFLMLVGRSQEAIVALEEAKARDPLNPQAAFLLAVAYSSVRNFPAAIAEFERGHALDPSWQFLFEIGAMSNAMATRDRTELRRLLSAQVARGPSPQAEFSARMTELLDRPPDALMFLREHFREPSTPAAMVGALAQWFAYFGDSEAALEAHSLALKRGQGAGPSTWYPVMREMRRLPEFKQLVREIGFVDYWREDGWGDFCKPLGADDFECQ